MAAWQVRPICSRYLAPIKCPIQPLTPPPPTHTHTQVRPASLQAAGPRGADGTGVWSIPALLAVLQFAFPRAAVSCPAAVGAEDRWNAPPPGATGPPQRAFRRAIELARAKVIKPLF